MKKKETLLSIFVGVLFLFGFVGGVSANTAEKIIRVYANENDGYITNWIKHDYGNSEFLWDKAHDALNGSSANSTRRSIEVGSGWSSDGYFFVHRNRSPFDLTALNNQSIESISLVVKISHVTNSLDDGNDFIVLTQASSTGLHNLSVSDYSQIGESLSSGWGNAHKSDIVEISNRVDISDIKIGDIVKFKLHEKFVKMISGKNDIILGLREGHDLLDIYPFYSELATANRINFYSMDDTNVDYHPYLEITYTTEDEDVKDPLILIPGILGSWPKNGELVLDPMLNTYENLWDALIASGYEENVNLFAFPYEWRNSNVTTANLLAQKIEEVKTLTGSDKVDIVAHSMGGLVAREYMSDENNADNVDQLIFLATPHRGAPNAYLTWEGGKFGTGFTALVKEQLFIQEAKENNYNNIYDYVRGSDISSVKELLPVFDYLRDKKSGELRSYPNEYPENKLLEKLNGTSSLSILNNIDVLNLVALGEVGNKNTLNIINVKKKCGPVVWEHGCPRFYSDDFEYSQGDGTVPERSNYFDFDFDTHSLISTHNRIVTDAQQDVIEELTGDRPSEFVDTAKTDKKMLLFQLFSPVDMQIRNEAGEMLGKNFDLNKNVMDIDGSYYSGFESLSEFASIMDPETGLYDIDLQGVADGEYKLVISYIAEDSVVQKESVGNIHNGEIKNLTINFSDDNIEVTTLSGFEKILFDLETLNDNGEIKKDRLYKRIKNKIERLEKRYEKTDNIKKIWKKRMLKRVIRIRLRILDRQLKFYERKDEISSKARDILHKDIQELKNML